MKRFFSLLIASLIATSTLAQADFDIVKATTRLPQENDRVYAKRVQRELDNRKSELIIELFLHTSKLDPKSSLNKETSPKADNIKILLENEIKPLDQLKKLFEEAVIIKKPDTIALTKDAMNQYVTALNARKKAIPSFNIEKAQTKEEVLKRFNYLFMNEGQQFFTEHFPGLKAKDMNLGKLKELYKKVEAEKLKASEKKPTKIITRPDIG